MAGGRLNVVIIGAGAMGSLYAALLSSEANVVVIDGWDVQIEAIRASGLTLTGIGGEVRPKLRALHVREARELTGWADVALALVNANDSRRAAQVAEVALSSDGYLVTLQNGIGNIEAYQRTLGAGRVAAGLSYHSAVVRDLALVEHTHRGPTWIGEIDRHETPRIRALADLLSRSGAEPRLVDDIVSHVWTKFIHNCAINAICAVAGLRVGEIPTTPGADELQTRIVEECLAVVRARGIAIADLDPMTSIKTFCRVKFNKPSMLQHMEASRETEIEALNGAVVREGAALGIPTPYNQAITWMVASMQHHRIKTAQRHDIDYEAMERRARERFG